MSDRKATYSAFCQNGYVPLHLQPWWLDAVCGCEHWKVALAMEHGDKILGAFPYYHLRYWGLNTIQLPPLTTYGGPWLHLPQPTDHKAASRLSLEHKVMGELIRQLPSVVFFKQNFRPECTNWLPFYWENYQQTTRYTYIFDAINDLEKTLAGFKNTLRSDLKKAKRLSVAIHDNETWPMVFELNQRSFQRKGLRQPYTFETFQSLHHALLERSQTAVFMAYDQDTGKPSAGLYLAFDERQASVLLTGTEPELKHQGAVLSLIWEAISFCAKQSIRLDFEGSMDKGIEYTFRAFGARLVPYFQLKKRWPQ